MRASHVLVLFAIFSGPVAAADLHQLWDQQCGGCHGHAAQFARASLTMVDGQLRGRLNDKDVAAFLIGHNGGYAPDDIAAIQAMLQAQVNTPELFKGKCGDCHETAAQLVREQIVSRDGALYGRYSHRRMADYLPKHGRLTQDETALLLDVLERIEQEVHRP